MENNRNYLIAIALSIAVMMVWFGFFAPKRTQEQQQPAQQTQTEQPAPSTAPQPGATAPTPGQSASVPQPSATTAPAAALETALKASPRVPVETPSLQGSIALRGARIDDLVLPKYRQTVNPDSPPVRLFAPAGGPDAYYSEQGWVADPKATVKLPTSDTLWQAPAGAKLTPGAPVTLTWDNGQGLVFRRTISVDEDYMFTVRQEVENKTGAAITLFPYALISRHGKPKIQSIYILHEGLIGVLGDNGLQEIDYDDLLEQPVNFSKVKAGWLGITDKYWAAVVVPNQADTYQARFSATQENGRDRFQADYLLDAVQVAAGGTANIEGRLFAGAKETQIVDSYAERYGIAKFDLLIDWGWFYFLTKPMFFALDFFYKLVGNFGLAILIVTVIIKIILFPLANKSYVSMSRMKKLQPEMQRLKERFENDKARQQQALMDLYRKEKVNPAAGCLPIVIQIPIFFALYKVLYITIEMRHAPFFGWIQDLSAPDPTTLFNLFGLIPWTPPHFLMIGIWPLIMGFTMFVQMQLNPAPPDPVQAKIFKWMPLFFMFLLAPFPAGLVIYWAWNNTLSVIQQSVIMRRQGVELALWDNLGLTALRKKFGKAAAPKTGKAKGASGQSKS